MSLDRLMVQAVTILTPGAGTNRYGDPSKDWATATETETRGWISQRIRSEDLDGREAQITGWVLFLPAATTITGRDRVLWDDLTFEVDGPVLPAHTPRGLHHLEVNLRAVTG